MRKLKGIKRKADSSGEPTPTAEQWRWLENSITSTRFPDNGDRRAALAAVRAILRYDSFSAKVQFEKLTDAGKKALAEILSEIDFELDLPDKPSTTTSRKPGKPDLKLV